MKENIPKPDDVDNVADIKVVVTEERLKVMKTVGLVHDVFITVLNKAGEQYTHSEDNKMIPKIPMKATLHEGEVYINITSPKDLSEFWKDVKKAEEAGEAEKAEGK